MDRGYAEATPQASPAGLSLFYGELVAAEQCDRTAGEPEGARPASDAMDRGYAEAAPQASPAGLSLFLGGPVAAAW